MPRSHPTRRSAAGVTLLELIVVIVFVGIVSAMAAPKVGLVVARSKVNQAAGVVAADLEQAVSLAARRRRPMVLATPSAGRYTVRDRATAGQDSIRLDRNLAAASDAGVTTLTFTPATVTIFPNGAVSAPMTVTLSGRGHTRSVTLSAAGQVRITP
jgi:type II secretion system protein H